MINFEEIKDKFPFITGLRCQTHEYIGIAYLKTDQVAKAEEHLARLEQICGAKCEQYEDLSRAIAAYKEKKTGTNSK